MRLEIASSKAIKYACLNFHYAKRLTLANLSYSVFNDNGEWCGVICFGQSSNRHVNANFGLQGNQVIELLRMALNGKQGKTSKAMAVAMKLLVKDAPLVKLLISYADNNQGHLGTIYQATNWIYIGQSNVDARSGIHIDNKPESYRGFGKRYGTTSQEKLKEILGNRIEFKDVKTKNKYIYPLDKSLIPMCKAMSKPYPKKPAALPHKGEGQSFQTEGAFDSTVPLNNSVTNP
jgi:hypothetical protein